MALPDSGPTFVIGFPEGRVPEALVSEIDRRRISFSFTDHARKSDTCQIEFDDRDHLIVDSGVFRHGTVVSVTWGYASRRAPTRNMVVKKMTGWDPITVELKDPSILMARDRLSWAYVDVTASDVARQVAARNGFDDEYVHVTDTTDRFETISQVSESDAAFLTRLAYKEGFVFYIAPDGLHWEERDLTQRPIRTLRLGDDESGPSDVVGTPTVRGNLLGLATTVVSASDGESVSASDATVRRVGLADVNELAEDRDLDSVVGQPTSAAGNVVAAGGFGPGSARLSGPDAKTTFGGERPENRIVGVTSDHDPDARPGRRARARYRRGQNEAVGIDLVVVGDPLLSARSIVRLVGAGRAFDGLWYVKEAGHRIGGGPYTTQLSLVRDGKRAQLASGDSRYDLGKALGRPGGRPRGRGDDGSSVGGDLVTQRLAALQRLTQSRASGAPLNQLTALASRTDAARRAWGQNGAGVVPQVRTVAREAAAIASATNDAPLAEAAESLLDAVAAIQPVEARSQATLNTLDPISDDGLATSLEALIEDATDSEGRAALSFRPRGVRIER